MNVRTLLPLLLIALSLAIFSSCSSDEEIDFTGTFEVSLLKDECDDSANDGQITRTSDGICFQQTTGEECLDITITINADGTYSYVSTSVTNSGGIRLSNPPNTETGTYTVLDNTITLTGSVDAVMEINDAETILEWLVADNTSNGCRRSYVLNKT